jgi:hypothetical protein
MGVSDQFHDPTVGAIRMSGGETGCARVQLHQTGLEQFTGLKFHTLGLFFQWLNSPLGAYAASFFGASQSHTF